MDARTGRWSDAGAPRRWVGSSSMEGGGSGGVGGDVVLGDLSDERMADEDVVDQFLSSAVDSAESLLGRDARGEVPKPLHVTVVGAVKAGRADLGARRPVEDLRRGRLHLI